VANFKPSPFQPWFDDTLGLFNYPAGACNLFLPFCTPFSILTFILQSTPHLLTKIASLTYLPLSILHELFRGGETPILIPPPPALPVPSSKSVDIRLRALRGAIQDQSPAANDLLAKDAGKKEEVGQKEQSTEKVEKWLEETEEA
jgi:hypothetical protein